MKYLLLSLLLTSPSLAGPQCHDYNPGPAPALTGRLVVTDTEDGIGLFDLARPAAGVKWFDVPGGNKAEVDISADGTQILYTVRKALDDFNSPAEIWRASLDGENAVKVLANEKFGGPVWHPDGKSFSFTLIEGRGNYFRQSFGSRARTRHAIQLPANAKSSPGDPEVSWDGKLLVFKMAVEGDVGEQPSIYVANADGSGLRRLTRGHSDHDPVFSRDNKKIYLERFHGAAAGDWFDCSQGRSFDKPACQWWSIVEVDVATARERIIVPHDPCGRHWFWLPTVSPDGRWLMYTHHDLKEQQQGGAKSDLWVSDLVNGGAPRKVQGTEEFYFFDWTK